MATPRLDETTDLGIEKQQRSRRRLIIIIAVAASVLAIAGGGAAWYVLRSDEGAATLAGTGAKGRKGKGESEVAVRHEPAQAPPLYHPLDPPFVANLPPGGKAKVLQAAVRVQTRDPALVSFLQRNDPMIRHHLLSLLGAQDASRLMTRTGREQLQADVQKTLAALARDNGGQGEVEAVYFTQFVLQ